MRSTTLGRNHSLNQFDQPRDVFLFLKNHGSTHRILTHLTLTLERKEEKKEKKEKKNTELDLRRETKKNSASQPARVPTCRCDVSLPPFWSEYCESVSDRSSSKPASKLVCTRYMRISKWTWKWHGISVIPSIFLPSH